MGLHPWDGVTQPNFELGPNTVGSRTNIREIDEAAKYSWIKAPRWRGNAMEVGPLARYIVGYASGTSGSPTRSRAFCAPWTCRSRRCSRRSVAPRPARSRRSIAPSCSSTSSTS
jgi:Ni,Fe-hydrogenase I large subunit